MVTFRGRDDIFTLSGALRNYTFSASGKKVFKFTSHLECFLATFAFRFFPIAERSQPHMH